MTAGVYAILFKGEEVALFSTDGITVSNIRNLPKDLGYREILRMVKGPYYKIVRKSV